MKERCFFFLEDVLVGCNFDVNYCTAESRTVLRTLMNMSFIDGNDKEDGKYYVAAMGVFSRVMKEIPEFNIDMAVGPLVVDSAGTKKRITEKRCIDMAIEKEKFKFVNTLICAGAPLAVPPS